MQAVHVTEAPLSAARIGELVFSGELLVFSQLSSVLELCAIADSLVCEALGDSKPQTAERRLPSEVFLKRMQALRRSFASDPQILEAMKASISATGLAREDTYWDRLELRIVPSKSSHHSRRIMPLPAHRDSWASNIPQQINWWTPLYPICSARTIVFYPAYWNRAIANDSADWDFWELKKRMAAGTAKGYPLLPTITEPVSEEDAVPLVIRPGDLLCFSAAHLHQSASDNSGITRFSLETRSVSASHRRSGIGAPNIDGSAPRTVPEWFENMSDGTSFADCLDSKA